MFSVTDLYNNDFIKFYANAYNSLFNLSEPYIVARWQAILNTTEGLSVKESMLGELFSGSMFLYTAVGNILFITCMVIGFALYLSNQGLRAISHNLNNTDSYSTAFTYLSDLEEEMGSLDDAMIYFLMFGVIIVWFFFFTLFSSFFVQNLSWLIALLNFIFLTAIISPVFVMKSYGLSFTTYIRGAGRTSNFVVEAFFDFLAVSVVMCRFIIQNIRLLMIFAAFFELSEFILDNCDLLGSSYVEKLFSLPVSWTNDGLYWYDTLADFLVQQFLLVYYQGHLIITFIGQIINYFALSFTLFFFLYTSFYLENQEKYFLYARL